MELIPAPAAQYVRPNIVNDSPLNEYFPPVELDECPCDCSSLTVFCLVAMVAETSECLASAATEDDSPVMSENECSPQDDDSENSDENTDSDPEEVEYFSETFSVKGSFWATRYQDALKKAVDLKANGVNVPVRASFESSNLKDKNAITFEVFDSTVWLVIGYCGVEKIPKLTKAIKKDEIISFKLCYIKRQWIPKISEFRFYAGVTIIKKDRWDKNDNNNQYNSDLSFLFE